MIKIIVYINDKNGFSKDVLLLLKLDSNENISNDEIYSKLVQSAKDTVWNIGYIDVKEDLVIYVPFHFIISSKDDVN